MDTLHGDCERALVPLGGTQRVGREMVSTGRLSRQRPILDVAIRKRTQRTKCSGFADRNNMTGPSEATPTVASGGGWGIAMPGGAPANALSHFGSSNCLIDKVLCRLRTCVGYPRGLATTTYLNKSS